MKLTVKYFGMLTEITHCDEETFPYAQTTIKELLETIFSKYPMLKEKEFNVAQHKELVSDDTIITGSEIVLLPPFSGG